jgi:hypothetical protein
VCSWRHYVGKPFWRGVLGATAVDFEAVRLLSAWTSLGGVSTEEGGEEGGDGSGTGAAAAAGGDTPAVAGEPAAWTDTIAARAALGRQCKRLIDAGRAHYLSHALHVPCELPASAHGTPGASAAGAAGGAFGSGGGVRLLHYCTQRDSLENALLLASMPVG